MKARFKRREVSLAVAAFASAAALATGTSSAVAAKVAGTYVTGDFHNHTTCSDGTLSVQKLVTKAADTWGLDWFVQAGHGGGGTRDCTLVEDATLATPGYPYDPTKGPTTTWANSVGLAALKGVRSSATDSNMWRWQSVQEIQYPLLEKLAVARNQPIFIGVESVVAGHEHSSTGVIDGQLPLDSTGTSFITAANSGTSFGAAAGAGNAMKMAMWEYCFDRADTDTSRGGGQSWDCSVPGSLNSANADWNATAAKLTNNTGTNGHLKTVEGVKWMGSFAANSSYYIPAHLERAGVFNPTANAGYNIEHLRDFNNAAPSVGFGFETMPGHQAEINRGSYSTGAVGGGTYGGVGIYGAAIGGVWDALLGEGRGWFFFASSDYHNRGSFGPDDRATTADFFPGEYTRDHVMVRTGTAKMTPQKIVDGLRSGNSFVANGQLIDRLGFVACVSYPGVGSRSNAAVENIAAAAAANNTDVDVSGCASMGEKLKVRPGGDVVVSFVVRDPQGPNNSPYSFPNPSLIQPGVGISHPLNQPVLDHVDLIGGNVSGFVAPGSANYAGLIGSAAASNPSTAIKATFNSATWTAQPEGWRRMTYRFTGVTASQYVRLRGTNLPPATPFETDSQGNPLLDFGAAGKIPCTDAACPAHLTVTNGVKTSSFDVAGWADLWFYSNPIFIEVAGSTVVAGIK
jgi:hypothetical protein